MKRTYIDPSCIDDDTIITDDLVLSICLYNNGTKVNGSAISDKGLKSMPRLAAYLLSRYLDVKNPREILYRIKNNIESDPTCVTCGKKVRFISFQKGYPKHCSTTCLNKDPEHIRKVKETCIEKYGGPICFSSKDILTKRDLTCIERYGDTNPFRFNSERHKEVIRNKYGVDNVFQNEAIKLKIKQTIVSKYGVEHPAQNSEIKEKARQTCIEKYGADCYISSVEGSERAKTVTLKRYGVEHALLNKEILISLLQTCLDRYGTKHPATLLQFKEKSKQTTFQHLGCEYAMLNEEVKQKGFETKRINKTWNTSKAEEEFYNYLTSCKYTVIQQYSSELYPFNCDFYIKELDLYIEILGTWTHGKHRYNPENSQDIEKLQFWQSKGTPFYESAIHTWTVRDPLKFETAEKNNLKYLPIYSCKLQECIKQFEEFVKTLE